MSNSPIKTQPRPTIKAVRGTRDLLPDQTPLWNRVEATARAVFSRYGFGEIRTPIFEDTSLFSRSVGEETDIVSKEMFTWEDGRRPHSRALQQSWLELNKQDLTLHPKQRVEGLRQAEAFTMADLQGIPSYIEFRAKPPKAPNSAIQKRITKSHQLGFGFVLVVTRTSANNLDSEAYSNLGVTIKILDRSPSKGWQALCLRPENTAGVVRAYIENKLGETGQLQKLYYIGPQFRRERPQKGRYRQFWQIGAEVIGSQASGAESPIRDAEILEMLASFLNELGIRDWKLEINSVGSSEDRVRYNAALREALAPVKDQLCPDNQRRAETNPLRVLDSKEEADQEIINGLPKIADFLSPDSASHFSQVLQALDACGVPYHLNPRLVRGLDYYTRTTFEFTVTTGLGTQNAMLGGGRYDGLSEMLGGPRAPGIGFAIGEDRLILTLQAQAEADGTSVAAPKLDAYIAPIGTAQNPAALALAHDLRAAGLTVEVGDGSFKIGKSFGFADAVARNVVLLGEDEVATGIITVKNFASGEQNKVPQSELVEILRLG
jgi:histidyl-tRNA synthetase